MWARNKFYRKLKKEKTPNIIKRLKTFRAQNEEKVAGKFDTLMAIWSKIIRYKNGILEDIKKWRAILLIWEIVS